MFTKTEAKRIEELKKNVVPYFFFSEVDKKLIEKVGKYNVGSVNACHGEYGWNQPPFKNQYFHIPRVLKSFKPRQVGPLPTVPVPMSREQVIRDLKTNLAQYCELPRPHRRMLKDIGDGSVSLLQRNGKWTYASGLGRGDEVYRLEEDYVDTHELDQEAERLQQAIGELLEESNTRVGKYPSSIGLEIVLHTTCGLEDLQFLSKVEVTYEV